MSGSSAGAGRGRWRRGCLLTGAAAAILLAAAALLWRPALRAAARFLVVSETPVEADLIVVHAGEPSRIAWGAELMRRGLAPHMLLFLDPTYERAIFGIPPEEATERTRQALVEMGIPRDHVTMARGVYSTWDEGLAAARYLRVHREVRRVLVVSNPFHMRRVRAVWRHALDTDPDPPETVFVPVPWDRTGLSLDRWWTRERELIWVQNEYVKLILYHFRYF